MADVSPRISEEEIAAGVERLAEEIAAAHPPGPAPPPVLIVLLKGAFVFAADLVRALHRHGLRPQIDFLSLASYGAGTKSRGVVDVRAEPTTDLTGRMVLVIDDILDSGRSLDEARRLLLARGAASIETCVLLDKPSRRVVACEGDYVGFRVANEFLVGYGIDWAESYRHLPWIGAVVGAGDS